MDSISFGLVAYALISLLHVHLVLRKFFNVLFFAMQILSLRTYSDCTWPIRSDSLEDLFQYYCSVRFCTNIFCLEFTICILTKVRHWLFFTSLLMEKR